jgi:Zn-finger protein
MPYDFFQNTSCEYFPCHKGVPAEDFNCLFCYCPLYALGKDCGGSPRYDNPSGLKDCASCVFPHVRDNYRAIVECIERVAGEYGRGGG